MPELHRQDGTLDAVHAVVEGVLDVVVATVLAPVAQPAHPGREGGIACDGTAPFAAGAQVLARIETEAAYGTERAGTASLPCRAMRLGRVLDDRDAVLRCDRHDGVHVGHAAVQVDGDDRSRARR